MWCGCGVSVLVWVRCECIGVVCGVSVLVWVRCECIGVVWVRCECVGVVWVRCECGWCGCGVCIGVGAV